jgi:hypothetical protein
LASTWSGSPTIADAAAGARAADAGPQIVLDEAVAVGRAAQLGLALHAVVLRVERLVADRVAGLAASSLDSSRSA